MYVGRRYTATVTGSVWKTIRCEFCGLEWAYQMTRQAEGTGRSPYFLDNQGAQQRASEEAHSTLERQLATEVDAVWCPKCTRLQTSMFGRARMNEFGKWYLFAGLTAAAGVLFCAFYGYRPWHENWVSPPGVFIFLAAIVLLVSTIIRSRLFDPNAVEQLRLRKGKEPPNKLLTRHEYETAMEMAMEQGVDRGKLLRLTWPSRRGR